MKSLSIIICTAGDSVNVGNVLGLIFAISVKFKFLLFWCNFFTIVMVFGWQEKGGQESFEELQKLFVEMFQSDLDGGFGASYESNVYGQFSSSSSSSQPFCNGNNKRDNSAMNSVKTSIGEFEVESTGFCFGTSDSGQPSKGRGNGDSKR